MSEDRDLLEEVLDRALVLHGRAEPRPGLELRVLAALRSRPPVPAWRALLASRPAWAALGVAVTAGAFAALFLAGTRHARETVTPSLASVPGPTAPVSVVDTTPSTPVTTFAEPPAAPGRPREAVRLASAPRSPRRASFPERRPLSEQEQLLLRYVAEAPREEIEPRAGFLDAPAPLPPAPDPTTES